MARLDPATLDPVTVPTRALADDCRAQSRTGLRRRSQGCCARASQPAKMPTRHAGGRHDIASAEPPWPAPTPATKSALTPAVTPAAPALGRRSANTAPTAIASPTMAPAMAVNAGSALALDADQPTVADQRQQNHHTQATRRAQKRSPKPHLSLTFPRGCTARRTTGWSSPPMQAPQRRLSPTWSIRLRVCQIARSNIGRRRINALRLGIAKCTHSTLPIYLPA